MHLTEYEVELMLKTLTSREFKLMNTLSKLETFPYV